MQHAGRNQTYVRLYFENLKVGGLLKTKGPDCRMVLKCRLNKRTYAGRGAIDPKSG
jgi:hypothetical protein